jgi:hypothetical protein
MRRGRITVPVALAVALTLGTGCGDRDDNVDIRTLDPDEMARLGKLTKADSQVVSALRAPPDSGRIIYDPPQDLSLATAIRTRRDLFGDTTRRDTSRTSTVRDTTGGDAMVDTSGGAARRPRP